MIERPVQQWLSSWNEYGTNQDTGRIVPVSVGVLAPEKASALAMSIAGEAPVTFTPDAFTRLREYLQWAFEEHQKILLRRETSSVDSPAQAPDAAVLTREEWRAVKNALQGDTKRVPEALSTLQASAPPSWTEEHNDESSG